jgi:hypothetical protein
MGRGDNFGGNEGIQHDMGTSFTHTRPEPETKAPKGTRSRPVKVRTHKLTTAYKQDIAATLDKLHAEGQTVEFMFPSPDVRGLEIITYTEE